MDERRQRFPHPRGASRCTVLGQAMLCVVMSALLCGCCLLQDSGAGLPPPGPPVYWYEGKLEQTLEARLADVHTASIRALEDISLPVIEDRADRISAHVRSAYPDSEPVVIDLAALGEHYTRVTVRVGLAGDRERAGYVLSRIRAYLAGGAAE